MSEKVIEEEFDIEDMRYYRNLDAKQKLDYLEQMNLFLLKITSKEAQEKNRTLKDEGF